MHLPDSLFNVEDVVPTFLQYVSACIFALEGMLSSSDVCCRGKNKHIVGRYISVMGFKAT